MAAFSDGVGMFHNLIWQQKQLKWEHFILLDKTDIDKVQLWRHNLKMKMEKICNVLLQ